MCWRPTVSALPGGEYLCYYSQIMAKSIPNSQKYKVIYNPHAGQKKHLLGKSNYNLEDIQDLLLQYQIPADFYPTKGPGDATIQAKQAIIQKYAGVLAAGGDGTVSEVATGLINSQMTLGILPLGTYMNIAKMLSVPTDLEKAVMLVKLNRTRKIDVGQVLEISGNKPKENIYFLENSGIGMEAELQEATLKWEKGDWSQIIKMMRILLDFYTQKITIKIDDKEITTHASLVEISNGPWTGAALNLAPDAKLNDHRLTVSVFRMQRWELLKIFAKILTHNPARSPKIDRYQGEKVSIISRNKRHVHADAREFGITPVTYAIIPNALNMVAGFSKTSEKNSLSPRTLLDS